MSRDDAPDGARDCGREVPRAVIRLGESIARLDDTWSELRTRLSPVTSMPNPSDGSKAMAVGAGQEECGLAEDIKGLAGKIDCISDVVQSTMSHLEI